VSLTQFAHVLAPTWVMIAIYFRRLGSVRLYKPSSLYAARTVAIAPKITALFKNSAETAIHANLINAVPLGSLAPVADPIDNLTACLAACKNTLLVLPILLRLASMIFSTK